MAMLQEWKNGAASGPAKRLPREPQRRAWHFLKSSMTQTGNSEPSELQVAVSTPTSSRTSEGNTSIEPDELCLTGDVAAEVHDGAFAQEIESPFGSSIHSEVVTPSSKTSFRLEDDADARLVLRFETFSSIDLARKRSDRMEVLSRIEALRASSWVCPRESLVPEFDSRLTLDEKFMGTNIYRMKSYQPSFTAKALVDWLIDEGACISYGQAEVIGQEMLDNGVFKHAWLGFSFQKFNAASRIDIFVPLLQQS